MWTVALTVTGLGGLWLVARHWQGWILYLINEVLWLAYGLTIHSTPVIVMAVLWFITGTRNLVVQRGLAREANLQDVREELRQADEPPSWTASVSSLCAYREAKHLDETALW